MELMEIEEKNLLPKILLLKGGGGPTENFRLRDCAGQLKMLRMGEIEIGGLLNIVQLTTLIKK